MIGTSPARQTSRMRRGLRALLLGLLLAAPLAGCTSVRRTDPPRTATEQFLLTTAISEAVAGLEAGALRGRRTFVDPAYLESTDKAFVLGEVRAMLLTEGVPLTGDRASAEVVLEVRTGGIGIDLYEFLLGLPSLNLGAVAASTGGPDVPLATPELALLKNTRQRGFAGLAFVAYWADTGELVASSGPVVGESHRADWWFFGVGPQSVSDIPPARPME